MLNRVLVRTVDFCTRHAWVIFITALILASGSAWYAARHFAVDTNISTLLSRDLPWRQRELAFKAAFPQEAESIVAVVQGPTPELARAAATALTEQLSKQKDLFRSVRESGEGAFFTRNGLLYLPTDEVARMTQQLGEASPLVRILVTDPSLRGLVQALNLGLRGVELNRFTLDDMAHTLNMAADTLDDALSGKRATFSWHVLVNGAPAKPEDLRRLIDIWPVLDYEALEPGQAATAAIRKAAADLELDSKFMSSVRLTGPVPIADQQFASLREGTTLNGLVTSALVLLILWLAMRSFRIVGAIVINVLAGLAVTAGLGLMLVGPLNPISMAFVVLFVGLGADFAIQFSVRYRNERHFKDDLHQALTNAAKNVGAPLTLAAASAAAGFLSFLPTSYSGLAELGLIAGSGMVVAFVASMTLLPALLRIVKPPGEPRPMGFASLRPADLFLQRHRIGVVAGTSILVIAGLPFLSHLQFDFSPTSLQNPNAESSATLRLLSNDPRINVNAAQVLAPPDDAAAVTKQLAALPEVARAQMLDSFVPDDQDRKLPLIQKAASLLNPAFQARRRPAPSDAEEVAALNSGASRLRQIAGRSSGAGRDAANRLADDLGKLAAATPTVREAARAAFVEPLQMDLDELRQSLHPERITAANLPDELVRYWVAPDGRMRIEAIPRGDPDDSETLRRFATAVLAVQPDATGQAIETYEWGRTVIRAFAQAGLWSLCSIAILLWLVLRRIGDVLLTLIPLLAAAALTLEICAITGFSLNYANIIALPVLLGVGVAFKVYYVMAWRRGESNFLESSLTRAVFFSALMTATAFGSLWLSQYAGMSSMGKLLALSLACTLASAALFQPALMGPPRRDRSGFGAPS